MENYFKESVAEVEDNCLPFGDLCPQEVLHMKVKTGTKLKNIIDYSVKHFIEKPTERHIVVTGGANSTTKAISCAEIIKRDFERQFKRHLFQMTKIGYKTVEEIWKPLDSSLDVLKVSRKIPQIYILLTKDELDVNLPGVQHKELTVCPLFADKNESKRGNKPKNQNKFKPKNSPNNYRKRKTDSNEAKGSDTPS